MSQHTNATGQCGETQSRRNHNIYWAYEAVMRQQWNNMQPVITLGGALPQGTHITCDTLVLLQDTHNPKPTIGTTCIMFNMCCNRIFMDPHFARNDPLQTFSHWLLYNGCPKEQICVKILIKNNKEGHSMLLTYLLHTALLKTMFTFRVDCSVLCPVELAHCPLGSSCSRSTTSKGWY